MDSRSPFLLISPEFHFSALVPRILLFKLMYIILTSSHTMVLGWAQPLTEMNTRNLPQVKEWLACKAVTVSQLCRKCGSLDVSPPYGFTQPVTGIPLPLFISIIIKVLFCLFTLTYSEIFHAASLLPLKHASTFLTYSLYLKLVLSSNRLYGAEFLTS
jgi:hypothetical protein